MSLTRISISETEGGNRYIFSDREDKHQQEEHHLSTGLELLITRVNSLM